jgi:hypothetical protein
MTLPVSRYLSSAEVARLGKAGKLRPFRIIPPEALARAKPADVARLARFVARTDYRHAAKRKP